MLKNFESIQGNYTLELMTFITDGQSGPNMNFMNDISPRFQSLSLFTRLNVTLAHPVSPVPSLINYLIIMSTLRIRLIR